MIETVGSATARPRRRRAAARRHGVAVLPRGHGGVVDTLFVDEAGQVSLADALAVGTCARNVVLLGDPQQLAQVSQGSHPAGAAVSVLEHLLGERRHGAARPRALPHTHLAHAPRRLPLHLRDQLRRGAARLPECASQRIDSPGLRGHGASRLARRARGEPPLVARGGEADRRRGRAARRRHLHRPRRPRARPDRGADVLVVTPYNAQVRCCGPACRTGWTSAPSTSSRGRRRRSCSSRWRPRAATTCPATSSSCSRATG